jgi:hypothetical protein
VPGEDGVAVNTLLSTPVMLLGAGALAATFVVLLVLALRRAGPDTKRLLWPLAALVVSGLVSIFVVDRLAQNDRAAERRAIEQRDAALTLQALTAGSPLGCLDSASGEAVESACENAVFADPQSVAAAVSYVTARLELLSDGLAFARADDPEFASRLSGVQRSIELDRFGIAAHVLASRDGCTADRCAAFALLRDSSALKANLRVRAYNEYVARHAIAWNSSTPAAERQPPAASAPQAPASPAVASLPAGAPQAPTVANPVPSRFDFPSAASIPPVSIMNAEPPLPPGAAAANAAAPGAAAAASVPMPQPRPPAQTAPPPAR